MLETVSFSYGNENVLLSGIGGDFIFEEIKNNKMFYEQQYLNYLKDKYNIAGKTVMDIGANIGNHSIFFKQIMKCGKIFCFEPINELRGFLEYNALQLDDSDDFSIYSYALGLVDKLHLGKKDKCNWGSYRATAGIDEQEVQCVTLDSMTFQEPIELIKIDVEGMEYEVLLSAIDTIQRLKPKIIILESWSIVETINTCGKFLFDIGYKLEPIFNLRNIENLWNLEFTL